MFHQILSVYLFFWGSKIIYKWKKKQYGEICGCGCRRMLNMHISRNQINWDILSMLLFCNLQSYKNVKCLQLFIFQPIISSYIFILIPLRQYLPFDIHCCYILMTNNVLFYRTDFAAFIFIDLSSNWI